MGLCAGLLNALLISALRIPSIVATLATGYILYSLIVAIQNGNIGGVTGAFERILRAQIGGFTGRALVGILTLVVMALVFLRTTYGRRLHAMGPKQGSCAAGGESALDV